MQVPVTIIKHPEYTERKKQLQLVQDACSTTGVKDAKQTYLPTTGDMNDLVEQQKYLNYWNRAVYYGFSGQTVRGMAGLAFLKGITAEADATTDYIIDDLDGDGVGLEQSMKSSLSSVYRDGRGGLLVDYPPVPEGLTKQQQAEFGARAIIKRYEALEICNWQTKKIGAVTVLSLVSLFEKADVIADDGLTVKRVGVERRLLLDENNQYMVEVYQDGELIDSYQPKAGGRVLNYIPFFFIGAENNDYRFDDSPMYAICDLNVGHYRDSADYQNSVFFLQPQPWAAGITQQWYEGMLKGFRFGSGSLFPLPEGGSFGIEQPDPNSQAFEAMEHKEKRMVSLGAKHLTGELSYSTATEAMIGEASSNSVLQTVMDNVERAYNDALATLAEFMGASAPVVVINTDLSNIVSDAQTAGIIVNAWMNGLIGKSDAREYMRKTGMIERTDEEIDQDLAEQIITESNNQFDTM